MSGANGWRRAPGATFAVTNPATGETLAEVPDFLEGETREAIEVAHGAFAEWRAKTAKERHALMRKWYELMMAAQEDLARIMTAEQGKPLAESRGEIAYGASFIEWFGEEGKRVYGDVIPHNQRGRRIVVLKEPVGVVGAITPWNFPNAMITRKCAPALAAGCTVVIKPASETPLSALALCELAHRAGIPGGRVQRGHVASIRRVVGKELTESPLIRAFSFTGSTEIGKILMRQCASTVKKMGMELGGNAPFIVFDDADLDAAVKGAMVSKFRNMGQTCVCANRILVQDSVYDAFAEKFTKAVAALKVGDGMDDGVEQGPLITEAAVEKVEALIADATKKGARVVLGGNRVQAGRHVLRAHGGARRDARDGGGARGNLRPRRHAVPLQDRRRGDPHGQRHRIRPRRLFLCPRCRPHLAGGGGAGIRHLRHQRRASSRPKWRPSAA